MPVLLLREISYCAHAVAAYALDVCAQFFEGRRRGCNICSYLWPWEAYRIEAEGGMALFPRHSSSSSARHKMYEDLNRAMSAALGLLFSRGLIPGLSQWDQYCCRSMSKKPRVSDHLCQGTQGDSTERWS